MFITLANRSVSIVLALVLGLPSVSAQVPVPDVSTLSRKVRDAVRLDYELQTQFTYIERRRDVKFSRTGKVTIGPLRTFEVYPSEQPGRTYKRLIAVDGKPLDPTELARRDAEHRRNILKASEQEKSETPMQRAARLRKEEDERRERDALLDDALAVFEPTVAGRETMDGQSVLVVTLEPRPKARVTTREGSWMKRFRGRVWVDEANYQIAKIDMHAFDDISIGWGIIGRIHEGSRFVFTRRNVGGTWLPAEVIYDASGRTLLFRPFEIRTTTTYSDYKRAPASATSLKDSR
jgi:hypothetical protein